MKNCVVWPIFRTSGSKQAIPVVLRHVTAAGKCLFTGFLTFYCLKTNTEILSKLKPHIARKSSGKPEYYPRKVPDFRKVLSIIEPNVPNSAL